MLITSLMSFSLFTSHFTNSQFLYILEGRFATDPVDRLSATTTKLSLSFTSLSLSELPMWPAPPVINIFLIYWLGVYGLQSSSSNCHLYLICSECPYSISILGLHDVRSSHETSS